MSTYQGPLAVSKPGMMSTGETNYATVENYIGSEATASALGSLHKPEVDEEITRRYGRDDLSGLLSQVPGYTKAIKYRKEYQHFEKDFIHGLVFASNAGGAASTTFTLISTSEASISQTVSPYIATTTNDVVVPQVKDILLLPGRFEVMIVSVDIGAGTFVAHSLDGVNIPATISTDELVIKTNQNEEGSGEVGKTRNSKLLIYQNNMGIHRRRHTVTGSEMGEQIWVQAEGKDGEHGMFWHYEGIHDEYRRFKNELEMTHFDGKQISNTTLANLAGFESITKTEGLIETIESFGNSLDYGATLSLANVQTITRKMDKFKADKTNLWLQGYDFRESMNALFREGDGIGDATTDPGRINDFTSGGGIADLAVNLDFERVKTNGFTFLVKVTNALSDPTTFGAEGMGYSSMGVVIPTGNTVSYNDLNDPTSRTTVKTIQLNYKVEPNGDSRLYKEWVTGGAGGISTNGEDKMNVWQLAECGLELFAINRFSLMFTTA